jgi:hypothetical protein
MSDRGHSVEKDAGLAVSRRGIVHVVRPLGGEAATACGKGSRDLVRIGAVGTGERMCHSCATRLQPEIKP